MRSSSPKRGTRWKSTECPRLRAYWANAHAPWRRPTDDTAAHVTAAVLGIQAIYRRGFNFAKTVVMPLDPQDGALQQGELDLEPEPAERGHLMGAFDTFNDRYGRGTVVLASAGVKGPQRDFEMKQNLLTSRYTTNWQALPVAKA